MGDATQMYGIAFSFALRFVPNPKRKRPNIGPYVYPTAVNTADTTLLLLVLLKIMIIAPINSENNKCTTILNLGRGFFSVTPIMSEQNEVVMAVSDESTDEYAAAVTPKRKHSPAKNPKWLSANVGKS